MSRVCGPSRHRASLLASEFAACIYCFSEFPPADIEEWIDGEPIGQTALCPYCSVDAVVGFDGSVDRAWIAEAHDRGFR